MQFHDCSTTVGLSCDSGPRRDCHRRSVAIRTTAASSLFERYDPYDGGIVSLCGSSCDPYDGGIAYYRGGRLIRGLRQHRVSPSVPAVSPISPGRQGARTPSDVRGKGRWPAPSGSRTYGTNHPRLWG